MLLSTSRLPAPLYMPTPHGFVERLAELSQSGVPFVCVTMVEAVGSTPQDAGSKMLVTPSGLVTGTVGGGRVEHKAIEHARSKCCRSRRRIRRRRRTLSNGISSATSA